MQESRKLEIQWTTGTANWMMLFAKSSSPLQTNVAAIAATLTALRTGDLGNKAKQQSSNLTNAAMLRTSKPFPGVPAKHMDWNSNQSHQSSEDIIANHHEAATAFFQTIPSIMATMIWPIHPKWSPECKLYFSVNSNRSATSSSNLSSTNGTLRHQWDRWLSIKHQAHQVWKYSSHLMPFSSGLLAISSKPDSQSLEMPSRTQSWDTLGNSAPC